MRSAPRRLPRYQPLRSALLLENRWRLALQRGAAARRARCDPGSLHRRSDGRLDRGQVLRYRQRGFLYLHEVVGPALLLRGRLLSEPTRIILDATIRWTETPWKPPRAWCRSGAMSTRRRSASVSRRRARTAKFSARSRTPAPPEVHAPPRARACRLWTGPDLLASDRARHGEPRCRGRDPRSTGILAARGRIVDACPELQSELKSAWHFIQSD